MSGRVPGQVRLALTVAVVSLMLGGCSTTARRVRCEGRLVPINLSAPVAAPASSGKRTATAPEAQAPRAP